MENTGGQKEFPVFIITTSSRKFDHLSYLADYYNLPDNYNIGFYQLPWEYEEIQSHNMEFLLDQAFDRDIFNKIRHTFFIIEQTSVFLDAKGGEGPGQFFKNWWETKEEEELKLMLSRDPGATIESGLALNVPGHGPLIFTNTQRGKINLDGEIREENQKYSWLSADDFNKYFVPQGATRVYNAMGITDFTKKYDFRRPNFETIANRLIEYSSVIRQDVTISKLNGAVSEYYDTEMKKSGKDKPNTNESLSQFT